MGDSATIFAPGSAFAKGRLLPPADAREPRRACCACPLRGSASRRRSPVQSPESPDELVRLSVSLDRPLLVDKSPLELPLLSAALCPCPPRPLAVIHSSG